MQVLGAANLHFSSAVGVQAVPAVGLMEFALLVVAGGFCRCSTAGAAPLSSVWGGFFGLPPWLCGSVGCEAGVFSWVCPCQPNEYLGIMIFGFIFVIGVNFWYSFVCSASCRCCFHPLDDEYICCFKKIINWSA